MRKVYSLAWLLVLALLPVSVVGCRKVDPDKGAKPKGSGAMGPAAPVAPSSTGLSGKIEETMDSGGYTYLRIATTEGSKWAAVRKTPVTVGAQVTVVAANLMKNFASPTLKRTFPEIYFGELGQAGGEGAAGVPPGMLPPGHPPIGTGAEGGAAEGGAATAGEAHAKVGQGKATLETPVTKAPGAEGRTVAELYAQSATLDGKPIAVRGKVTKWNTNIMSKNWAHLQDGSGTEAEKNFDLTVTTAGTVAVGDVVLVKGTLRANKDFGAGYSYKVIVEDATIEK